jgi:xylulokinase
MGRYLLGIDEGTTGCRACIFDFEGNLVSSDYREYPCYYPKPGWVEQKPEDITPALYASVQAAIAKGDVDAKEIEALGISTQADVVGPLDKEGNLLRPFIGWQDLRGASYIESLTKEHLSGPEYYAISGAPMNAIFGITKLVWFRDNERELYEKTAILSNHQEYFLRAFGVDSGYYTDLSSASRTGMLDVDNGKWSEKLFQAFSLDVAKFPTVVPDNPVVGTVTRAVAEKTSLVEGTKIVVAAHDQNCSTFGCGLVDAGTASLVLGTWGSLYVGLDRPIRDPNGVLIVKGNHGLGNWTIEGAATAAASSYRWFRDTLGGVEVAAGKLIGKDPYELINEEVASVAPGANGVAFLPFLQGASAGPRANPFARGVLFGITLGTSHSELARAVMEGITLEMRDILEAQRRGGVEITSIHLTGGGTKSRMWNQMQADIYKVPVHVLQTSDTGALGAAMYAGVGAGVYSSHKQAAETAVHVQETYEPVSRNFAAYDDAYSRFVSVYTALHEGKVF